MFLKILRKSHTHQEIYCFEMNSRHFLEVSDLIQDPIIPQVIMVVEFVDPRQNIESVGFDEFHCSRLPVLNDSISLLNFASRK